MQSNFSFARAAEFAGQILQADNRRVAVSSDFDRIANELVSGPKGRLSPENRPSLHRLTSENCFYLTVRSDGGALIGFCAAHLFDTGASSFPTFLGDLYTDLYGAGSPAIFETDLPPVADEISGRIVYFGDFFLHQSAKGRGGIDPVALSVFFFSTVASKWSADWIFGFAKGRNVKRGLGAKYLSARSYPNAIRWRVEGENRFDDDWMLCSNRREYTFALERWFNGVSSVPNMSAPFGPLSLCEPAIASADT